MRPERLNKFRPLPITLGSVSCCLNILNILNTMRLNIVETKAHAKQVYKLNIIIHYNTLF